MREAILALCALSFTSVHAEFRVIDDRSAHRPFASRTETLSPEGESSNANAADPLLGAADPRAWLPIRSPGLAPGPVTARTHERPFARPFFLIGAGTLSRQWLQTHRDQLKRLGAVGMLVQADTVDEVRAIAALADGLPILPASASDLAKALGITHYPVLISAHGIEQ